MEGFFGVIIDTIAHHSAWAGPILGLLAFGESLAFVGLFFPCTALMLAAGALVGTGALDPWPVILWSIAGAVLGDAVSYWAGRWFWPTVRRFQAMRTRRRVFAQGRLFFRRWGAASIFLGRFLGPMRAIVPLVAGFMRMHQRRFQIVNVASAIVWVPAMLAPGWLLAISLDEIGSLGEGPMLAMTAGPALLGFASLLYLLRLARRRAPASAGRLRGPARPDLALAIERALPARALPPSS